MCDFDDHQAVGLYSVTKGELANTNLLRRIEEKMMLCHMHRQLSSCRSAKPFKQFLPTEMGR
jgi:hypothetical protein